MKNYKFIIDDKTYTVYADEKGKAMEICNRQILDKHYSYIKHMAWFGNDDDKSIPKDTFKLVRGNFFD